MNGGEFSVCRFFTGGTYQYVCRFVSAEQAVRTAKRCAENAAAGTTVQRVIITDGGDCTCFMWEQGRGITFPTLPPPEGEE